jgi:YggT family protein
VSSSIHYLLDTFLWLFLVAVIVSVILSWLVQFGVINRGSPFVSQLGDFLYKLTEPALRPIRNVLPDLGGIDISPVILIVGIEFVRRLLANMLL